MMRLQLIFFAILSVTLLGCRSGGDGELPAGFVAMTNDELGLSISYPDAWVTDSVEAEMIVASDSAVILESDYTGAAAVIFFVEPIEKVGSDLMAFAETELVGEQAEFIVEQPAKMEINGLEAVSVLMAQPQGDLDLFLGTTLIKKDDQVAFVLTVYDSDVEQTYASTLDRIVNSVQFVEEE